MWSFPMEFWAKLLERSLTGIDVHGHKCTCLFDCTIEKVVCGLMSGIEFKTTCHSSKN